MAADTYRIFHRNIMPKVIDKNPYGVRKLVASTSSVDNRTEQNSKDRNPAERVIARFRSAVSRAAPAEVTQFTSRKYPVHTRSASQVDKKRGSAAPWFSTGSRPCSDALQAY
jgi:hypothetical protein